MIDTQVQDVATLETQIAPVPQFAFVVDTDLVHVGGGSAVLLY
jgi:hypothetical protein